MNVEYGIKNFRVFDKDGARFTLKPITMLTGVSIITKSVEIKLKNEDFFSYHSLHIEHLE